MIMKRKQSTPWGLADFQKKVAPGITIFHTPGHGGIRVSKKLAETRMNRSDLERAAIIYKGQYWFEEDCAWACVAIAFPNCFADTLEIARKTYAHWYGEKSA